MTSTQVHLIRKTFALFSRHEHVAALIFYQRLFELDPALRPLFTGDIEEQARKLMEMLGVLIAMLERPLGLELELRAMGSRHAGYGVKDSHYATVAEALLATLHEVLAEQFTVEARAAWTALYRAVETMMKQGATEAQEAELVPSSIAL